MTPWKKTEKKLPLEGIRVLDFCHIWVGPYASQLLADWGAEVIWVESRYHSVRGLARPNPAAVRQGQAFGYPDKEPGERPWNRSAGINRHTRNKLSITVDNRTDAGRDIVHRLMAKADVVMENQVPVTAERFGLTWDEVSAINPQIILMNMPAFGLTGPYKNYRTLGSHMEAISGHQIMRAYPHMDPGQLSDVFPADAGGAAAVAAVIMGLIHRKNNGKGLHIEFATAENFIPYMGDYVMDYTMNGRVHQHEGNRDWSMAPHQVYACQGEEQWVTIACRDDRDWQALCGVMGNPEWAADAKFVDTLSRYQNRDELDGKMSRWTADKDKFWVMSALQSAGVPVGPVYDEKDALEDSHLAERGFFEEVTHPDAGTHLYPGIQWKFSKTPNHIRRHAPQLGQDNEYIYKDVLGYNDEEYQRLTEAGHIGMEYDESVR